MKEIAVALSQLQDAKAAGAKWIASRCEFIGQDVEIAAESAKQEIDELAAGMHERLAEYKAERVAACSRIDERAVQACVHEQSRAAQRLQLLLIGHEVVTDRQVSDCCPCHAPCQPTNITFSLSRLQGIGQGGRGERRGQAAARAHAAASASARHGRHELRLQLARGRHLRQMHRIAQAVLQHPAANRGT